MKFEINQINNIDELDTSDKILLDIFNISKNRFMKLICIRLNDISIDDNIIDIKIYIEDTLDQYTDNSDLIVFILDSKIDELGNYNTNKLINALEQYEFMQYDNYLVYCGNSAGIEFRNNYKIH